MQEHAQRIRNTKTRVAATHARNLRDTHELSHVEAEPQGSSHREFAKVRKMVEIENVNHPGQVRLVDAAMYGAMRRAFLKILPKTPPGLTVEEIYGKVEPELPKDLFPGGAKAGWWAKAVQLDLEAKGIIVREKARPLRLHRV